MLHAYLIVTEITIIDRQCSVMYEEDNVLTDIATHTVTPRLKIQRMQRDLTSSTISEHLWSFLQAVWVMTCVHGAMVYILELLFRWVLISRLLLLT